MLHNVTGSDIKLDVQKLVELPAISPVIDKLLEAIADEDITIGSFAEIIEQEPSLLSRIIGLANSAYFGHTDPIVTVEEAIFNSLGLRLTKSLALGIALAGKFRGTLKVAGFDLQTFWLEAIRSAVLAQALSQCITVDPKPGRDEAYLAGLLHNFGLLPMVHLYPEDMAAVMSEQNADPALGEALQQAYGLDHHQVGAWLAEKWHIPKQVVLVLKHHHQSEYDGEFKSLVKLIHACVIWAQHYAVEQDWQKIPNETLKVLAELGITEEKLHELQQIIQDNVENIQAVVKVFVAGGV